MPRRHDIAKPEQMQRQRIWPTRVGLGLWLAFCLAMCVLDASWAPVAVLFATLFVVIVSVLLGVFSGSRLSVTIEVPECARKAEPALCKMTVRNNSALPLWKAELPVCVSNPLTGERFTLSTFASALPHGTADVGFEIESPYCGCLNLSVDGAYAHDISGIVRRRRDLRASASVVVHPLAAALATAQSGARAHDIESFTYAPNRKGDDPSETFAVREYEPGDSVRRIHWKLSTKLGTTMLRESSFPIYSTLLLLLETGFARGELDPAKADAHMEASVSLMLALLEAGIAFELAYLDRRSGHMGIERIADQGQLWDSVASLLAAPREETDESSVRPLLEVSGSTVWARVAYIACGSIGADAQELVSSGGQLTVLRCTDNPSSSKETGLFTELSFAPSSWADDLAGLEL